MAVLALAALAAVLLRPLCDALEPIQAAAAAPSGIQQDHHSPDEPCCASAADGSFAPPSSAVALMFDGGYDAIPDRALRFPSRPSLHLPALDPPRRPPRSLPFHVRTARILA